MIDRLRNASRSFRAQREAAAALVLRPFALRPFALWPLVLWLLAFWVLALGPAGAQTAQGIYKPGDAVATGFSDALAPFEIGRGETADSHMTIDAAGPSLRVIDLRRMGGPPSAQLVPAPKPFTVEAGRIGQVFGLALDDQSPPNIYVAATSAYGLAIVASGADGRARRVRTGAPGVSFMAAQWGPGAGPGSIWKIGAFGEVSLFANVSNAGRANAGAALGGLAYDGASKSLYVADRESGLIHRLAMNGAALGVYDHGVVGRAAAGFEPVADRPSGVSITSPDFDTARPESWGFASPERRVFGLAVREGRLYYAIAEDLQVWSVGLVEGAFGADARIEVAAPPAAGPTEISRIVFDDQGRMYLAERAAPTGAQDFGALATSAIARVLRYAPIGATPTRRIWVPAPDDYAIGFPETFRNVNGGVAIGYGYDSQGDLDPRTCGGFLWTTGERLRESSDETIAARLAQTGSLDVDGVQGNPAWRIRRRDAAPWFSYFISYFDPPDERRNAEPRRGHMGDVAIARTCAQQAADYEPRTGYDAGVPPPPFMTVPPQLRRPPGRRVCALRVCAPDRKTACPPNQVWRLDGDACAPDCLPSERLVNGKCCSARDLRRGGACWSDDPGKPTCAPTQIAIGPDCCEADRVYSGPGGAKRCCASALANGLCGPPKLEIPKIPCPTCCAEGYVPIKGTCCLKAQATSSGVCCPSGQSPSADGKTCLSLIKRPRLPVCCAEGFTPTAKGSCCALANLTTSGECCSTALDPKNRSTCAAPSKTTTAPPAPCGRGRVRDERGVCVRAPRPAATPLVPLRPSACRPGERRDESGVCVQREPAPFPQVTPRRPPPPAVRIPARPPLVCPPGWRPGPLGQRCLPPRRAVPPPAIAPRAPILCPPGWTPGPLGRRCLPSRGERFAPPRPGFAPRQPGFAPQMMAPRMMAPSINCPPGWAPGPMGRRCVPSFR